MQEELISQSKAGKDPCPSSKQSGRRNSLLAFLFCIQMIRWGPPTRGRAICFTQLTNSNTNLTQKGPHWHAENNVWPNVTLWPVKLTRKITQHITSSLCYFQSTVFYHLAYCYPIYGTAWKGPRFYPFLCLCPLPCVSEDPPIKGWICFSTIWIMAALRTLFDQCNEAEAPLCYFWPGVSKTLLLSSWNAKLPCKALRLTCWRMRGHEDQEQTTSAKATQTQESRARPRSANPTP